MGISRKELEKHRDFFKKILKSKKNPQLEDIVNQAKLTELKALQGVVKSVLRFSIPLTSLQKHRLKPNRCNVRKFALTKPTTKESLRSSLKPVVPSLRTLVRPLFPQYSGPREKTLPVSTLADSKATPRETPPAPPPIPSSTPSTDGEPEAETEAEATTSSSQPNLTDDSSESTPDVSESSRSPKLESGASDTE
jgi:hypothetical protein